MGIRVMVTEQPCHDSDYLCVSTCSDPNDDTVTLATIQRVVEKIDDEQHRKPKRNVKTLVMEAPMSPDAALGFATRYAERKQIPVIYTKKD